MAALYSYRLTVVKPLAGGLIISEPPEASRLWRGWRIEMKMTNPRCSVPVLTLSLLGLVLPSPTQAAQVFHAQSRGNAATVNWNDPDGSGFAGVIVFNEGGSGGNQDAFVTYFIARTSDQEVVEFGFGSIPRAHVSGSGNGAMRLDTDTSAAANPGFTRLAGEGGRITLEVRKTSDVFRRISGTQQLRFGGARLNSNGSETTVSAAATGFAIVGNVGGLASAELASSRTLTIELVAETR